MKDEFEKDMNEDIIEESESYPVMPLRNTVLFPQQVIPIYIGREKSLKLINESYHLDISTGLDKECAAFKNLFNSDDTAEGLSAFINKRTPSFKGK